MKRYFWLWLVTVIFFIGCSDDSEGPKIPPLFVSSTPSDGAEGVVISSEVSVTFDEVVTLADNHGVTVNGQSADATAQLTKLLISLNLEKETDYSVRVPPGAVINTNGVPLEKEVEFSFSTEVEPEPVEISSNLVVINPSPEAVNVYNYLKDSYGSRIISGAMANVNWNVNEAEWVFQHTGKYPVMATFDYIHLASSPANWIDYSDTQVVEDWWSAGGIVSSSWHWLVPTAEGATTMTYKPSETTFNAANATVEGTWENDFVKTDLEEMAGYLKLLQEKNIPMVWRPLHEAAGNIYEYNDGTAWFWWGTGGAEAYRNLWIYMFEYFEQQGLNNLIWVWTTQTKDDPFYPGDEYVDIVGRDIYNNQSGVNIAGQFEDIQASYPDKIITLSENGNVAPISEQWGSGALWSYFMPWYDYDRTLDPESAAFDEISHMHADIDWWQDAFALEAVITRDELPNFK